MPITLQQAKALQFGDILYSNFNSNADNSPKRWKVSGKVKRWKNDPDRIEVPLKHGLYQHGYICYGIIANRIHQKLYSATFELNSFSLTEEEAIKIYKGN